MFLGHTCTIVQPHDDLVDLQTCLALVQSPLVLGVLRVERGRCLDLYPRDIAAIPIPHGWRAGDPQTLGEALGLTAEQAERLSWLGA
jgi:hypothetical protein